MRSVGERARAGIQVHNFGPPIPPGALDGIFEPFKRESPNADSQRGIGLGLFIVREIVTAHRGQVRVASDKESGTTFTVELPRHVEVAASTPNTWE